jgi:hypothetical protein
MNTSRQSSTAAAVLRAAAGHGLTEPGADLLETETAGGPEQAEDAQQQAEVAHPVDHKGLLGGVGGTVAVVPEAHQQVGAHAHQLPEHIDLEQVGADHQAQHRTAEQGQVGEKAHVALVMGHVAIGIHHHQQGDGGHQRQHHGPEGIHPEAHLQVEVPALAQLNSTSVAGAPASCSARMAKLSTAAAPTQLISRIATGLRNRLTVRLKLIRPRPVMAAPARGKHGDQPGEFGS